MLTYKGATVTDPLHIANIFNDYFSSITEKLKSILQGNLGSSDPFGSVLLVRCVCKSIFQCELFKLKQKVKQSITFR